MEELRFDSLILVELTRHKDGLEKTTGRFLTDRVLNFFPLDQDYINWARLIL